MAYGVNLKKSDQFWGFYICKSLQLCLIISSAVNILTVAEPNLYRNSHRLGYCKAGKIMAFLSLENFTITSLLQTCMLAIECWQICQKFGILIAMSISEGRVSHFSKVTWSEIPFFLILNKNSRWNGICVELSRKRWYPSLHIDLSFTFMKFEGPCPPFVNTKHVSSVF